MILPSFGLLNWFLTNYTRKLVFGLSTMALAMVGISFLGFVVWAHHVYTAGLEADTRAYFTAVTIMISIPTGTKIFNWLLNLYVSATLWLDIQFVLLFFVIIFVIGGASGVLLGNAGLDIVLHDTYYVVGHFHQVLAIASVLSILLYLIGLHENNHAFGAFASVNPAQLAILISLLFVNINVLFMNMIFMGFNVMPRRIPEYSDGLILFNSVSTFNAIMICLLLLTATL